MTALEADLRRASALSDLSMGGDRLATKIDMSPEGLEARLREASDLLDLCRRLAATRPMADGNGGGGSAT